MLALAAAAAQQSNHWFTTAYTEYQGLNPSHVVFMAVPFFITLLAVYHLAVKPLVKVTEQREERTEGARAEAAALESKFTDRLRAYETRLAATRQQAAEERAAIRKEAALEEERILAAARTDATKAVEDVRASVEAERTRVRGELKRQAEQLAQELAEKALGREIGGKATMRRETRTGVQS